MQMLTKSAKGILLAVGFSAAAPAVAALEPGAFMTKDGAVITPVLVTGVSHNDNFFSTPTDEESRLIWNIAPSLDALIEDGVNYYNVNAATSTNLHNKDSADNFTQINLGAATHNEFTSRHRLDLSANADWMFEPRGSGLTEGLGDAANELVEYRQQNMAARYEFGALSSKAQIAFTGAYFNKNYQNFREISQYRDYERTSFGVIGYYNTQAATRTFLELKQEDYRYDVIDANGVNRDSDDFKALVGMEWEATAVTSGSVKLGYQKKDFTAPQRKNFSGLSWEAAITWQPLSYSYVDIMTSRAAKDPLVQGDYIKESMYRATWTHDWSQYLSTTAGLSYTDEQYVGLIGRKDETTNINIAVSYETNSFGMVSTYVDFIDKDSTQNAIKFDRVVVGINFTFALKAN